MINLQAAWQSASGGFIGKQWVETEAENVSSDGNYRCVVETHTRVGGEHRECIVEYQKRTSGWGKWREIRREEAPSKGSLSYGVFWL